MVASNKVQKVLNYSLDYDCKTGQQLRAFADLDCSEPYMSDGQTLKQVKVDFTQVYVPHFIMGQTQAFAIVDRSGVAFAN